MGLIYAGADAVVGTLADQWPSFFTAPPFDEQGLVHPGVLRQRKSGRGLLRRGPSTNVVTDGSRILVPENTAVVITDGGRITSVSVEPGYFEFRNDGVPSLFEGSGVGRSLIAQSWERFKFGGAPARQQLIHFVNLSEVRNLKFGTPGPLAYSDYSLAPGSAQVPVLRLRARGQYSVRIVDPVRFFRNFLPPNVRTYSLADPAASSQLAQEFITTFQAALQMLSRTTPIASLASHGPALADALTSVGGPEGSWRDRFGLQVVAVAISAIEYDDASRALMDKYNQGVLLGGDVGNAYAQTTVADAARALAESGAGGTGMVGMAMGLGALGGTVSGMAQPTPTPDASTDPVAVLGRLKAMLDQGLITPEQYAAKQQEILDRM